VKRSGCLDALTVQCQYSGPRLAESQNSAPHGITGRYGFRQIKATRIAREAQALLNFRQTPADERAFGSLVMRNRGLCHRTARATTADELRSASIGNRSLCRITRGTLRRSRQPITLTIPAA
jgi:hypothetical protein